MAVELNFEKSDNESWGFRLTGGVEYDVPLIVIKVIENSIAEKGGLLVNDVVVRVNDTSTAGLTHSDAHDLLIATGNNLVLAVRRDLGDLIHPTINDDEGNEEIANIMQATIENEENLMLEKHVDFEIINPLDESSNISRASEPSNSEIEKEAITVRNNLHNVMTSAEEKKWSTFLQKPRNPKPAPKKTDEQPKGEPYRVIIKKQKKKSQEDTKQLQEEQIVKEQETIPENVEDQETAEVKENLDCTEEEAASEAITQDITVQAEVTEEESRIEDEALSNESDVEDKELESPDARLEQKEVDAALDQVIEEKLLEVQRQLEALSHLPSTIQSTIDAVSKQLASIVQIKSSSNENEQDKTSETDEAEEEAACEENTDYKNEEEEQDLGSGDEANNEENIQEDDQEELQENPSSDSPDTEKELTEEEKAAIRAEEELLEKKQKDHPIMEEFKQRRLEQRPTLPLEPIERPIILPGGRRWSQPDDVIPAIRKPKMTDDKIANTIETYSEVIVGKLKGINFLKYQPPPKNLDYLQKSDVYKLVHDLEPPVRGIGNRVSKILAEQDYYQAG